MNKGLLIFLLTSMVYGFQTESVFPWLTNNANFKSRVIINNQNNREVEVFLVATRNDGSEDGAIRTIGPLGQLVESAATLFPNLGEGPGYSVIATCNDENITSAFIINSQSGESGSSPAQADVLPPAGAGNNILFNYMPIGGGGASAPVVVNMGPNEATVIFHAFQNGAEVGTSDPVAVASGRPFAQVTSVLFPEVSGDTYVVAESDMPLLGMAFIFNEFGEPSMASATVVPAVPGGSVEPSTLTVLVGEPVTGINDFMGLPILDFGPTFGQPILPTIGVFNEEGNLTSPLEPSMLDNPEAWLMAAGNGLVPTGNDTFNNNITLDKIPVLTGFNGFFFTRVVLPLISDVEDLTDASMALPNEPVTLAQWLGAKGNAYIRCREDGGSQVSIHAEGLLPNRIYTTWASFGVNGVLETVVFGGVPNAMATDVNGKGSLIREIPYCPLHPREGEPPLFLLDVVLHSDQQIYATLPTLSQPGKDAHAQLGFFFAGTRLEKTRAAYSKIKHQRR